MNTKLTKLATIGAAATAIGAVGFFTVPAPAQAAPPCDKYGFGLGLDLVQSNGYSVGIDTDGKNTSAATGTAGSGNNRGTVSGGVNGRNVDFTIHWSGGAQGRYTGTVSDDGNVHGGATVDVAHPGSGASWDSTTPFVCIRQSVPTALPQAPPPPPAAANVAKVLSDVDVYDKTNTYNKTKIGTLVAPSTVTLAEPCDYTGDCHVLVPTMQGGNGYAWAPGALQPGP